MSNRRVRVLRYFLLAVAFCAIQSLCPHLSSAQQNADGSPQAGNHTAIQGQYDQGVPVPRFIPVSGFRQDAGALAAINQYRSQTGVQVWTDMKAQGSIRFGNDQSVQGQAVIEIGHPAKFRMDITLDGGKTRSLRRSGDREAVSRGTAAVRQVDTRDAAEGVFLFPRLEEKTFPKSSDLLIDDGSTIVDGQPYHRITLEYPPSAVGNQNNFSSWIVVDLYFDPSTHLLTKSACVVHSIGSSAVVLRVITYGAYRKSGQALIPMSYRETLNGQIAWTLTLSQVTLNGGISDQDFTF